MISNKRRSIVLSFVLITLTTAHLHAQQSIQIGLKAGGNYMRVGGRSFDGKFYPGLDGGIYAELNFSDHWTLQPELYYDQIVPKTSEGFNSIYGGTSFQQVFLNYVTLPVLATFKPVPELSIQLGPQYSYLVNQTTGLFGLQQQDREVFKKSDFSLAFGAQLNVGKVKVGARYNVGLIGINGINTTDDWRKYGLQFYLGYQIWNKQLKKKK